MNNAKPTNKDYENWARLLMRKANQSRNEKFKKTMVKLANANDKRG